MQFIFYIKIKYIHQLLLKRYGKRILTFLNIFFASILLLFIFILFSVIKTTNPELLKQLIVFLITILFVGDITNIVSIINLETVLSISVLKIYPVSNWMRLVSIFICFLKHSRSILYILPASYMCFKLCDSTDSLAFLFLGLVLLYLITTAFVTLLFYFLDLIKYKYGIRNIALIFLPVFFSFAFFGNTPFIYDSFIINFIYKILLNLI